MDAVRGADLIQRHKLGLAYDISSQVVISNLRENLTLETPEFVPATVQGQYKINK